MTSSAGWRLLQQPTKENQEMKVVLFNVVLSLLSLFLGAALLGNVKKTKKAEVFIDHLGYTTAWQQFLEGAPLPPPIGSENDPNYRARVVKKGGHLYIIPPPALKKR
jgi:hypothetical protein